MKKMIMSLALLALGSHSGFAEDDGVDEYDVNHRQKRGDTGHEFSADIRPLPGKFKIPIQQC